MAYQKVKHPQGTRANLNTLATANNLVVGQLYLITDESRVAIATAVNAYTDFAKVAEIGKRITATTGASLAFDCSTTDIASHVNTLATGTLTIGAPTNLYDRAKVEIHIKTTNVQNFSWHATFAGTQDLNLPSTTSGSSKWDYFAFRYSADAAKLHFLGRSMGA